MSTTKACPCGSGKGYDACCRPFHGGTAAPATAEELMRSRYSAFVVGDSDCVGYLLATWHPATRPASLELDDALRWTGLEVLATDAGGPTDRRGMVEFRAGYLRDGVVGDLHETSRFRRDNEGWQYVRGRAVWS